MTKILLADDEERAREYLKEILKELFPEAIIHTAKNGLEALLEIEKQSFNYIFLDIQMPKMTGLEVAQSCYQKNLNLIFTTAYHQHALEAFEVSALDYVLKPFNKVRIAKAIAKCERSKKFFPVEKSNSLFEKICLKVNGSYRILPLQKISAVLRLDDYLEVYFEEEKLLISETLDGLAKKLPCNKFVRIHRSHLVNLDYVKELKILGDRNFSVLLSDYYELELSISRNLIQELKKKIGA